MNMILNVLVFLPFAGGLLAYLAGNYGEKIEAKGILKGNSQGKDVGKYEMLRNGIACLTVVIELALMIFLIVTYGPEMYAHHGEALFSAVVPYFGGFGLHFTLDGFRLIYAAIVAFMWAGATLLSGEYFRHHHNTNRFYLFLLWTLGATMAVFLSADLATTFIFFEIMSFTSYVWVAQEENAGALRAAGTYLAVAVIGGLVMLMGVMVLHHNLGTLMIGELLAATEAFQGDKTWIYIARFCLFFGFAAKAGAFPLHIWLPKAHPVAPAPASALLSGILTKTGMYGILIVSFQLFLYDQAWSGFVLGIGVLTMFGGALLAVFSVDLKRTLACSSMSQIGFILVGVGMAGFLGEHGQLAVHGTVLHMVNHSLIKLVLFMAAGVIYMNAHALHLNEIRGFGRKKPLLKGAFLVGALAIGGIPMFSGYISKTLIHESIVEYGAVGMFRLVEYLFLFSGGLTVAYMTKIFKAVFLEKNADPEIQKKYDDMKHYMNPISAAALTVSAGVLFIWGLFPHQIMDKCAELAQGFLNFHPHGEGHVVAYFSMVNLKGAIISIVIGALVYALVIRKFLVREDQYINAWPEWLDVENLLYRPVLLKILPAIFGSICGFFDGLADRVVNILRRTIYKDMPTEEKEKSVDTFSKAAGTVLNVLQWISNATWKSQDKASEDYVHSMALWKKEFDDEEELIEYSLSFGLMLFCIGFCIVFIYLVM